MDVILKEFPVYYHEWEMDGTGWIMQRPDGTRYLKMTSHGREYEAEPDELTEKIAEYENAIDQTREALALLQQ